MSSYLRFLAKALAVVVATSLLAAWPVHAIAGSDGLLAFLAAAGVCFVGAAIGRIPHLFFKRGPDAIVHASMAGVGARLLGTISLATPLLLLDVLPELPLAVGLVVNYSVLLAFEVRELVVLSRDGGATDGGATEEPVPTATCPSDPKGAPTR